MVDISGESSPTDNIIRMKHFADDLRTMSTEDYGRELVVTFLMSQGLPRAAAIHQASAFSVEQMESLSQGVIAAIGAMLDHFNKNSE